MVYVVNLGKIQIPIEEIPIGGRVIIYNNEEGRFVEGTLSIEPGGLGDTFKFVEGLLRRNPVPKWQPPAKMAEKQKNPLPN